MTARDRPIDPFLLTATYTAVLAAGLFLFSLNRLGDRPVLGPLVSLARLGLLGGAVAGVGGLAIVIWRLRRAGEAERRVRVLTLVMALVTVAAVLLVCEAAVRVFSVREAGRSVFLGTKLLPRRWEEAAAYYPDLVRTETYYIYDDRLGWRPGPGRTSANGLYFSSTEGLRSPRPGIPVLGTTTAPGQAAPFKVALVGDSYTFGEDVTYEQTWGAQLEQLLGPGAVVRNFGVPAFGVDQAVLRYERDVRPWHPQVVILAPIQHDFLRTMTVYTFLAFPDWEIPFSKPRFVLRGGKLVLLNSPTMTPGAIFGHARVTDLPLIAYDPGYDLDEWWSPVWYRSYLVRFLASRSPPLRNPPESADSSMRQSAVNRALLRRFVTETRADGAVPILARLPSTAEFAQEPGRFKISRQLIGEVGDAMGVRHTDLTEALSALDPSRLRATTGLAWHYSPEANRVVAEHFAGIIRGLGPWARRNGATAQRR
jgi:hypothetical protein